MPHLASDLFGPGSPLRVIGHRGAASVAPENTIPAFEHAVRTGADAVELDIRLSSDEQLVVIHDSTLQRTTNGSGPVEELTLSQLRKYDAGYRFTPDRGRTFPFREEGVRIPRLDEVLEAVEDLPVIVEVKCGPAGRVLGEWLPKSKDRERILVGGFERADVQPATVQARWRCAYEDELRRYVILGKAGVGGWFAPKECAAVMVPERQKAIRVVTPRFVRRAHADGIGVFVWTVNEPSDMRRLFAWGVDGLVSDAPGRLRRVLDEIQANGDS